MADDHDKRRLTLTVDWPQITLADLSRLAGLWSRLVDSVSAEATGKKTGIRWVIRSITLASPLEIVSDPQVTNDKIAPVVTERVSRSLLTGIQHLIKYQDQPEGFSHDSLHVARKLAELADPLQQRRMSISNGTGSAVEVTSRVISSVDLIFGPVLESYGSVEGTLEGVITHGKRRFYVYDSLVGRQVRCHFDNMRIKLPEVLQAFEKRVVVSGLIRSRAMTGQRISIDAARFQVFPPDNELMSLAEIQDLWNGKPQ